MTKASQLRAFGIENLEVGPYKNPELGPHDVRIAFHAASLNYRDYLMVTGQYNPKVPMPFVPVSDGAGTLLEVGAGVTAFRPGERVVTFMTPSWRDDDPPANVHQLALGATFDGVLAEERVMPETAILHTPDYLSDAEAACLPIAGLTAWTALVEVGQVQAGSKVLLLGTGGVSIWALQIAKALGAEVTITSSSDEKLKRAALLGADHLIHYKAEPQWGKKIAASGPVDLVVEVGGEGTLEQSIRATRNGGTIALIGVLAQAKSAPLLTPVVMRAIRIQGVLVGSYAAFLRFKQFLEQRRIHPILDRRFHGLDAASDALHALKGGGHFGKIVIEF